MLIIEIIASDFITCGVDHNFKLKALNKFSEEICKSNNICNRLFLVQTLTERSVLHLNWKGWNSRS